jgi:hypothetical protein
MGLIEKIEEIRKKPDHIKLRYVWFFVIICMFLIISIWFLSLRADLSDSFLKKKRVPQETSEIQQSSSDFFQEINKQKDALKNAQFDTSSEQNNN